MSAIQIIMILTMIAYLVFVVAIGFYYSKQNTGVDDFYLGGRKLGPFVTAMSAEASDMSSWLLMGLPGVAYLSGVADAGWTAIGLAVGTYLNWLIVAKRLRFYTHKTGSITIPDFFSDRFGDDKNMLCCIAAAIIIIFFVPYTASGFAACGKLFNTLFGVDYRVAMVICAAAIIVYTSLGGFLAASVTDFIQSIVMTIALLMVLIFGVWSCGGIDVVAENAKALPGYLSFTQSYSVESGEASPYGLLTIVSTMAWGLGYFGMPHILLRFMAIEDKDKLTMSRRIASIWVVISMAIAVVIGIIGYSMSKADVIPVLEGSASETVIVQIANVFSQYGILFAVLAGIILAGILASTMSTSDSQLLTAASAFSENICHRVFGIKLSNSASLVVARISVIGIALIGAFIAKDPDSSVFQIVSFAWAGFGATFAPVILLGLFWKRANKWGALASMISGGVVVFVWHFLIKPIGGIWGIYELLPAFIIAMICNVIVSLVTPAPSAEVVKMYEDVQKQLHD